MKREELMGLMKRSGCYKSILWQNVSKGFEVYLAGTHLGKFKAYGPHWVHDVDRRMLINSRGQKFMHYSEELCIKLE